MKRTKKRGRPVTGRTKEQFTITCDAGVFHEFERAARKLKQLRSHILERLMKDFLQKYNQEN